MKWKSSIYSRNQDHLIIFIIIISSSNPFTLYGAYGIHEDLPGIAVSSCSLTSFHDLLVLLISLYIVFPHVIFPLSVLLHPRGFQAKAFFSIGNQDTILEFFLQDRRQRRESLILVDCVKSSIRSKYLPNTSQER